LQSTLVFLKKVILITWEPSIPTPFPPTLLPPLWISVPHFFLSCLEVLSSDPWCWLKFLGWPLNAFYYMAGHKTCLNCCLIQTPASSMESLTVTNLRKKKCKQANQGTEKAWRHSANTREPPGR
jgi:hypothetical protein